MTCSIGRVLWLAASVVLLLLALLLFVRPLVAGAGHGTGGPVTRVHVQR
jgi:hypothetical protein